MNIYEVSSALSSRFNTEVATPEDLPTQYDNVFKKLNTTTGEDDLWCRFAIEFTGNTQTSIGVPSSHRYRRFGSAVAQLFMKLNKGDKDILQLADIIEGKFKTLSIGGLTIQTPNTLIIGDEGNGYYQINVVCPFYANQIG